MMHDRVSDCFQVKDDKPLVEGRKEKTVGSVNPETERQRRLVTEQVLTVQLVIASVYAA